MTDSSNDFVVTNDSEPATALSDLLIPLFDHLDRKRYAYCVCGNYEGLPYRTTNDVDIWAENVDAVIDSLKTSARNAGLELYLENKNAAGSNLFFWKLTSDGPITLHLDVLRECRWLSFLPLVTAEQLKQKREKFGEITVASETIDAAMHFVHPLTHFGRVVDKYKQDFIGQIDDPAFWKLLVDSLGGQFVEKIEPHFVSQNWTAIEEEFGKQRASIFFHAASRMKTEHYVSFSRFFRSNFARILQPNGLFIAFIGPDGCGKTTVQKNLEIFFAKSFTKGKVSKFYWRPFLLPRIRSLLPGTPARDSIDRDPAERLDLRSTSPIKRISHCLKLVYYCLDFCLGRLKYQANWSKGGVVCFDRYWDDLWVFPERFGLTAPRWLVKSLGLLVPSPDIVFYLHADAEVLTARKLELPIDEMKRQISDYKHLSQVKKNCVLIAADQPEQEVMNSVIFQSLTMMTRRRAQ